MAAVEDVFKALGDPIRIQIVSMLANNGEMCVCKIMEELGMTQPAVSHHLAALKNVGLVHPRRQGQWIHYSLSRATISDVALTYLRRILDRLDAAENRSSCECK